MQTPEEILKRKSWEWFVLKEWLLLPLSIFHAATCKTPMLIRHMMKKVHPTNKIMPYKIIMWVLEQRIK